MSLSSLSFEVPLAWLPSRMFCLPERAGLDHLVSGARAFVDEAIAETHRAVEHDTGFLEGEKVFVAAVRRREALGLGGTG